MLKLGILASTNGTDMLPIIAAIAQGDLDATIEVVISNRQDAGALEKARAASLPAVWIDPKQFSTREAFDGAVATELEARQVDLVLMIGYMRIVTPIFVKRFENRMLNVHPSLLPAFGGGMDRNVHEDVLKSGVKVTGCTIHFVTAEVDSGPIVYQKAVEIAEDETVDTLKAKVQAEEGRGFVQVIRWFSEGKVRVEGNIVHIREDRS